MYNYENCEFYSECIAISADAASFNVEIFHSTNPTDRTKIGKANVLLNRHPALNEKNISVSTQIFNDGINDIVKLRKLIEKHCVERCKSI